MVEAEQRMPENEESRLAENEAGESTSLKERCCGKSNRVLAGRLTAGVAARRQAARTHISGRSLLWHAERQVDHTDTGLNRRNR